MSSSSQRLVPKVHPATRPAEPEDPWALHATPAAGDPEVMLECLVQEYAWMGWDIEQIMALFRDPFFPALHALWRGCGEECIHERVARVLQRMSVFRFRSVVHDEPERTEPVLIELGVPASWRSKEKSHAQGE
jgi:hypothetical protein